MTYKVWYGIKPKQTNKQTNKQTKMDLAFHNLQWLICYETKSTQNDLIRLPWISYATQKLMLDSCKMVEKQSEAFHTFLWYFFQV